MGVARLYATWQGNGAQAFGVFLSNRGLPLGLELAWIVTIVETVGGIALAGGVAVPYLALWFAVELLVGIALVHARLGWFVVGPHTGGMEYSVVLIAAMLVVASASLEEPVPDRGAP